jgi:hypothetical protein
MRAVTVSTRPGHFLPDWDIDWDCGIGLIWNAVLFQIFDVSSSDFRGLSDFGVFSYY